MAMPPTTDKSINIGDVEAVVAIEFTIAQESRSPQVQVEEVITPNVRKTLGMSNVTVSAPYPEKLVASIKFTSANNFEDQPVAFRGRVLREGTEVGTFSAVLGKYARGRAPRGVVVPRMSFTADIFKDLSSKPKSMLLFAEAEAFLLPMGTDEATVDPLTVTATAEFKTAITSNPMRVDFVAPAEMN